MAGEDIFAQALRGDMSGIESAIAKAMAMATERQAQQAQGPHRENMYEPGPGEWDFAGKRLVKQPYEQPPAPPPSDQDAGYDQGQGGSEDETSRLEREALEQNRALEFANQFLSPDNEGAVDATSQYYVQDPMEGGGDPFASGRAREALGKKPKGGWASFGDLPKEIQGPLLKAVREGQI